MNRDMDLVREILMKLEVSDGPVDVNDLVTVEWSRDFVAYHFKIMDEAGLIESNRAFADNQLFMAQANSLTWEGHEYLDSVKSDTVWRKVKEKLAKVGGSASIDVVKSLAVAVGKKLLSDELSVTLG